MQKIAKQLFEMQDTSYKVFQSKLMPTVDPDSIIGIRTPVLRKYANILSKSDDRFKFLESLPHSYYEENNLHAFLIEKITDYDLCVAETNRFLPHINNWATCDSFSPKVFSKHKAELLNQIKIWVTSTHSYTVRFAIKMLMTFYLDEDFSSEYAHLVASVRNDDYYVKMMVAWYFATALAKQYECAVMYLEQKTLPAWIHNKTIQKARESFRISNVQKDYLKTLKII